MYFVVWQNLDSKNTRNSKITHLEVYKYRKNNFYFIFSIRIDNSPFFNSKAMLGLFEKLLITVRK